MRTRHRTIAAIDPGNNTGVCVFDRISREIQAICTKNFRTVRPYLANMFPDRDVTILVEVAAAFVYNRNKKKFNRMNNQTGNLPFATGQIISASRLKAMQSGEFAGMAEGAEDRMMFNIGGVRREGQLLIEEFKDLGFEDVQEVLPILQPKWTQARFELQMKCLTECNEHERDAARLASYYTS